MRGIYARKDLFVNGKNSLPHSYRVAHDSHIDGLNSKGAPQLARYESKSSLKSTTSESDGPSWAVGNVDERSVYGGAMQHETR